MVVVSTFTFVLSTIEELQESEEGKSDYPLVVQVIDVVDHIVVIFFTFEYLARLIVCPKKVKFMKNAMNMVDLLAILPYYISLVIEGLEDYEIIGKASDLNNNCFVILLSENYIIFIFKAGKIIRLIRIMRILRIFKVDLIINAKSVLDEQFSFSSLFVTLLAFSP